jgi:hypothetical protein
MIHAIACRTLGIKHLRTRAYHPKTNGKAERFIRTMLSGWAYGAVYRNSTERTAALDGWLWNYSHRRRHSASATNRPSLASTNEESTHSRLTDRLCAQRSFHHERRLHALRLVARQRAEQGVVAGTEIDRQAQMTIRRSVRKGTGYRAFGLFDRVQVVFVLAVVDEFYDHLAGGYGGTRKDEAKRFGVFGGDLDARGRFRGGSSRGFSRWVFVNRSLRRLAGIGCRR